jgi:hypothetical protein
MIAGAVILDRAPRGPWIEALGDMDCAGSLGPISW